MMDINFKILQSKYFNNKKIEIVIKIVVKIFALKNFKINIHQNVSRAFNILHYSMNVFNCFKATKVNEFCKKKKKLLQQPASINCV